jgi:hypothetical protein
VLLDGHVGEVDEHVVQLTGTGCVLHRAEAAEPQLVPETHTMSIIREPRVL